MTNYKVIRSRRKTISIIINKNAEVEIRAPLTASKAEIDIFIQSSREWIDTHLDYKKRILAEKAAFTLNYGDTVSVLGKECAVIASTENQTGFDGNNIYIPSGLSPEEIKRAVVQVYKQTAKEFLMKKVVDYVNLTGLIPTAVNISDAKTRWGSCSNRNSIRLSWHLIMADIDTIEYVVVHELAHIKEHNHSERFWAVVSSIIPNHKEREHKLKELLKRIEIEDWQ